MGELLVSAGTALAAFAVHLIVWRVRLPARHTRAILAIFFGTLSAEILALPYIAYHWPAVGIPVPVPLQSHVSIIGFVTAAALSYAVTYSAVEADSPSLVMVLSIDRAGKEGLAEGEFLRNMSDELLVEPRIRDLLRDGLIRAEGDRYRLTAKGARMTRLFLLHRSLLGAGKGG